GAGQVCGRLPLNGEAAPGASAAWSASAAGPTHGGIAGQQAVDDRHRLLASDMDTAAHGGTSSPTSGARTPDDLIAHEAAVGDVEPSPIASETASDAGAVGGGSTGCQRAADGLVGGERRTQNGRICRRLDGAAPREANVATGCPEGLIAGERGVRDRHGGTRAAEGVLGRDDTAESLPPGAASATVRLVAGERGVR